MLLLPLLNRINIYIYILNWFFTEASHNQKLAATCTPTWEKSPRMNKTNGAKQEVHNFGLSAHSPQSSQLHVTTHKVN